MSSYKNVRDEQMRERESAGSAMHGQNEEPQFDAMDAFAAMGDGAREATWHTLYRAREALRSRGVPDVHESSRALYDAMKAVRGPAQPLGGTDDIMLAGETAADRHGFRYGLAMDNTLVRHDFTDSELDVAREVLESVAVHASEGRLPAKLSVCGREKADTLGDCGLEDSDDLIYAMARYFIDEIECNRGKINKTMRDAVSLNGVRA